MLLWLPPTLQTLLCIVFCNQETQHESNKSIWLSWQHEGWCNSFVTWAHARSVSKVFWLKIHIQYYRCLAPLQNVCWQLYYALCWKCCISIMHLPQSKWEYLIYREVVYHREGINNAELAQGLLTMCEKQLPWKENLYWPTEALPGILSKCGLSVTNARLSVISRLLM